MVHWCSSTVCDAYEDEWIKDKAHGFGVYTHYNGSKYSDDWVLNNIIQD